MWPRLVSWFSRIWRDRATTRSAPPVESMQSLAFRARLRVDDREAEELQMLLDQLDRAVAHQRHPQ